MSLLFQGIALGIGLGFLVGPLLFMFIQVGLERGFHAGIFAGLGVWTSDFLFILSTYWGVSYAMRLIEWEGFKFWLALLGGIILIIIGAGIILKKTSMKEALSKKGSTLSGFSYFNLWLKGFLINTINPFSVFFWFGVSSTFSTDTALTPSDARLFYGGILGTVMITDMLKIWFGKKIRNFLSPSYIYLVQRIAGTALIIFGVVLIIRGMV